MSPVRNNTVWSNTEKYSSDETLFEKLKKCGIKCSAQNKNVAEIFYMTPMCPNQLTSSHFAGPFKTAVRGNKYYCDNMSFYGIS
jgi:hypothetical protein